MPTPTETIYCIEPCLLQNPPLDVVDLVAELTSLTEQLGARLHPDAAASLADMVRIMNCYYSNLIEGHNTLPRDIERALANELDNDQARRNLQIEARAHIRVQKLIDEMHTQNALPEPASCDFLQWLHAEFYRDASDEMLMIKQGQQDFKMVPGEFRSLTVHDVAVGRHLPPSSEAVTDFMRHFEQRYRLETMGKGSRILAMAAAHHRLAFIHPFPDGNGRVSRLMSHAMGLKAGIGAFGLWSISRGLARGLNSRQEYKQMMDVADSPRQGDLDGRGNLSQQALTEFVRWFLSVCIDQAKFMTSLFEFDQLANRLKIYTERQGLRPEAFFILQRILLQGEMPRGEAERVTGLKERSARMVLADLVKDGIVNSQTPKGPISLRFTSQSIDMLFPRLFAES
ncbi:Fic family protein [Methylomonas sp. HYX-M1]|uniref:Fic family protein n=1 Tax=Methylomonas sp. HYX-M1 TaxID=3139307 RepID=UPI00345C4864